jgi:hypothetical protein
VRIGVGTSISTGFEGAMLDQASSSAVKVASDEMLRQRALLLRNCVPPFRRSA